MPLPLEDGTDSVLYCFPKVLHHSGFPVAASIAMTLPILSWPITIFFCVPFSNFTLVILLPHDVSQSWVSGIFTFLMTVPCPRNGVAQISLRFVIFKANI